MAYQKQATKIVTKIVRCEILFLRDICQNGKDDIQTFYKKKNVKR